MRALLCVSFSLVSWFGSANAASVEFLQDGWSPGGLLRVAFSGNDFNTNGAVEVSELFEFSASWATPVGDTTLWTIANIEPDGFLFADLDNYVFFVRNPDFSLVSTALNGERLASVFDSLLFPVSSSAGAPAAIPEPSSLFLLGVSMTALYKWGRKKK